MSRAPGIVLLPLPWSGSPSHRRPSIPAPAPIRAKQAPHGQHRHPAWPRRRAGRPSRSPGTRPRRDAGPGGHSNTPRTGPGQPPNRRPPGNPGRLVPVGPPVRPVARGSRPGPGQPAGYRTDSRASSSDSAGLPGRPARALAELSESLLVLGNVACLWDWVNNLPANDAGLVDDESAASRDALLFIEDTVGLRYRSVWPEV